MFLGRRHYCAPCDSEGLDSDDVTRTAEQAFHLQRRDDGPDTGQSSDNDGQGHHTDHATSGAYDDETRSHAYKREKNQNKGLTVFFAQQTYPDFTKARKRNSLSRAKVSRELSKKKSKPSSKETKTVPKTKETNNSSKEKSAASNNSSKEKSAASNNSSKEKSAASSQDKNNFRKLRYNSSKRQRQLQFSFRSYFRASRSESARDAFYRDIYIEELSRGFSTVSRTDSKSSKNRFCCGPCGGGSLYGFSGDIVAYVAQHVTSFSEDTPEDLQACEWVDKFDEHTSHMSHSKHDINKGQKTLSHSKPPKKVDRSGLLPQESWGSTSIHHVKTMHDYWECFVNRKSGCNNGRRPGPDGLEHFKLPYLAVVFVSFPHWINLSPKTQLLAKEIFDSLASEQTVSLGKNSRIQLVFEFLLGETVGDSDSDSSKTTKDDLQKTKDDLQKNVPAKEYDIFDSSTSSNILRCSGKEGKDTMMNEAETHMMTNGEEHDIDLPSLYSYGLRKYPGASLFFLVQSFEILAASVFSWSMFLPEMLTPGMLARSFGTLSDDASRENGEHNSLYVGLTRENDPYDCSSEELFGVSRDIAQWISRGNPSSRTDDSVGKDIVSSETLTGSLENSSHKNTLVYANGTLKNSVQNKTSQILSGLQNKTGESRSVSLLSPCVEKVSACRFVCEFELATRKKVNREGLIFFEYPTDYSTA